MDCRSTFQGKFDAYLTPRELAQRLRLSGRTLERWRAARRGPAWITVGGSVRYRMRDVLAWEAAHMTRP